VHARVRFHGRLAPDAVRRLMASASLLVLPSRRMPDGDRDGIANVLIEAMALGVPVVTTTAGAAEEVVGDRLTGRLVPPDDVPALAAAIDELLGDAEQRGRLAQAARTTVETYFDSRSTGVALSSLLASHARVRPISSSRQPAP
jgi:glycosyltransferase involved in cell wall biosynthesis